MDDDYLTNGQVQVLYISEMDYLSIFVTVEQLEIHKPPLVSTHTYIQIVSMKEMSSR